MDSETLALFAAALNAPLRDSLRESDFSKDNRPVVTALKDARKKESRACVQQWLRDHGVSWDAKTPIGESVVEAHRRHTLKGAFASNIYELRVLAVSVNILGWERFEKLANGLQGLIDELRATDRQCGARPGTETHPERDSSDGVRDGSDGTPRQGGTDVLG